MRIKIQPTSEPDAHDPDKMFTLQTSCLRDFIIWFRPTEMGILQDGLLSKLGEVQQQVVRIFVLLNPPPRLVMSCQEAQGREGSQRCQDSNCAFILAYAYKKAVECKYRFHYPSNHLSLSLLFLYNPSFFLNLFT